jgi:primase-polymerase (primpol)-like protein
VFELSDGTEQMNDKQLQALAKKNAAKSAEAKKKARASFDATLDATRPPEAEEQSEADAIFREMKRREF